MRFYPLPSILPLKLNKLNRFIIVWKIVTFPGELAESVMYQGPLLGERMVLGDIGFWSNSSRSNTYYLMGRDGTFDATQAEIIGAIDGLIIAKELPKWIHKFRNLRLSQVLDMYYSNRGVQVDEIVRACDRGRIFSHVAPKTIMEAQVNTSRFVLVSFFKRSVEIFNKFFIDLHDVPNFGILQRHRSHAGDIFEDYSKLRGR